LLQKKKKKKKDWILYNNVDGTKQLGDLGIAATMANTLDRHRTAAGTPYWYVNLFCFVQMLMLCMELWW
jgi:hypothetical protein